MLFTSAQITAPQRPIRTLRYDARFQQPWSPKVCDFALEQTIPAGAYVDTDQLDDLMRAGRLRYFTHARPNVELMAHQAQSFVVYVYGDTDTERTVELPVHFRYHLPSAHHRFAKVTIPPPRMHMDCSTKDASRMPHSYYCWLPGEGGIPCKDALDAACPWSRTGYSLHSDPIVVWLPVGNSVIEPLVTFVTVLVAWVGCYYISREVFRKTRELEREFS